MNGKIFTAQLCLLLTFIGFAITSPCAADETPVVVSDSVWYDADAGELLPIKVSDQRTDTMNRNSRWTPKPPDATKPKTAPTTSTGNAWGSMTWGNFFGWFFLMILMGALVGMLVYVFANSSFDFRPPAIQQTVISQRALDEQTKQRIAELPAELRETDVNPRTELERLMQRGDFDRAIIFLYGHQLLLLDRAGCLRLSRWKTNSQYVRETRSIDPSSSELLGRTVDAFERSYFGRHALTRSQFDILWQDNLHLESTITAKGDSE